MHNSKQDIPSNNMVSLVLISMILKVEFIIIISLKCMPLQQIKTKTNLVLTLTISKVVPNMVRIKVERITIKLATMEIHAIKQTVINLVQTLTTFKVIPNMDRIKGKITRLTTMHLPTTAVTINLVLTLTTSMAVHNMVKANQLKVQEELTINQMSTMEVMISTCRVIFKVTNPQNQEYPNHMNSPMMKNSR